MKDFTGEAWDTWYDGCGIYHLDAMDEESGEKIMIADNIVGVDRARLMRFAPDLLFACETMKHVCLEQMGFRSYSKCEQDAIDVMLGAIRLANGGQS